MLLRNVAALKSVYGLADGYGAGIIILRTAAWMGGMFWLYAYIMSKVVRD